MAGIQTNRSVPLCNRPHLQRALLGTPHEYRVVRLGWIQHAWSGPVPSECRLARKRFLSSISYAGTMIRSRLVVTVCAASLVVTACASPPRPVGPTTLSGPLPGPTRGASSTASGAPDSTDGPILIRDARFSWTHVAATESTYEWSCTVENPSNTGFRVTIVVHLLDAGGRRVSSSNQAFRLDGKSILPISGDGLIEGDASTALTNWEIESWVQIPDTMRRR